MKRLILVILTICTLSGCGLFKKKSKEIDKHSENTEQSSDKQTNIEFQDKSKSLEVNTSVSSEVAINGYIVKAGVIKFNPDGSFEASGDVSLHGNSQWQRDKQDSTAKEVEADVVANVNEVEKIEQSNEVKDYSKATKSETDFFGIIAGACGVVVIVIGVVWYLRK